MSLAVPIFGAIFACSAASSQSLGGPSGAEDGGTDATAQEAGGGEDAGGGGDGGADGGSTGKDSGDEDGGATEDARPDAYVGACNLDGGPFPIDAFPSGCMTVDACVAVLHEVSCCGARQAIGIDVTASADFEKAEKAWEATCPPCECPVNPDAIAQDGKTGPADKVQVKCDFSGPSLNGKCKTFFP